MAKVQTRRSISLSEAMHRAVMERARSLNMSAAEYVHGLAACDMECAGIVPPPHLSPKEQVRRRQAAQKRAREALPKLSPIAKARATGEPVRVFKPLPPPAPFEAPEPLPVTPDDLPSPHLRVVGEPCCSWCCEPFNPQARRPNRRRTDTDRGPTHVDCAAERARVESRTAARMAMGGAR